MNSAQFRFYEELNDFLPIEKRKQDFVFSFQGNPAIKDAIEAIGVPHVEVDLILVNGESKDFNYPLRDHDQVSVYPVFEAFDISPVTHLRPQPLRQPQFILDVHLGTLARYLRLLGFDVWYDNGYDDVEIVRIAFQQSRIILTRDLGLLKNKIVTRGYWLRNVKPKQQVSEVLDRFNLREQVKVFSRCLVCNGFIEPVPKQAILDQLLPKTKMYYEKFFQCQQCHKIYWQGAHFKKMLALVNELLVFF